MKPVLCIVAALVNFLCLASVAHTQPAWPTKPVTFLQPYSTGTNIDALTRLLAAKLSSKWGVPVINENKPGANGAIGTEIVARAPADGYTFLFTGPGFFTNEILIRNNRYDPIKNFKPVARMASLMTVLVVPSKSPFNSLRELIDYAKKNPGKLSYASAGIGSGSHLPAALLTEQAGIEVLHVPYKGQAQAMTDTIGGQVDFYFAVTTSALEQRNGGNVKILAVSGRKRAQALPEIPTIADAAGLLNYEFVAFNAVFAPAGTPDAIIKKFSDDIAAVVVSPEYVEIIKKNGLDSDFLDVEGWTRAVPLEKKKWAEIIRASGAKPES